MEQNQSFNDLLFQAIMERQQYFDSMLLPKLQEEFRIMQSASKTILTVLQKKGVIRDDPYNYDSKRADIEVPPEDTFSDNEKAAIIGRRLSQYEAMLDYLNNYYQFNCDYLATDRIQKMVALNRTFTWESFSITSTRPNTKGLADLVNNIRNGSDPLSISIINDALTQLSKSSISITKTLKMLTDFHRERYKTAVRKMVMPGAVINPASLSNGTSAALKEIKKSFAVNMKDQPFYTELIEEILKEEYSPEHAVLQQELLARLAISKQNQTKTASAESLKPVLLDGIRTLGSVSPQLDEIVAKLAENNHLLANIEKSFFEKFSELLKKAFNIKKQDELIWITSIDPATQTGKREQLNLTEFIEDIRHRSRIFTGFTLRSSPAFQKIELMDESQILDLLTRNLAELGTVLKQCAGLDDYFKQNAPPEIRDRVRGIKVEISAIRNNIVKANQCRAEYASQVEEQQQLKKLGITHG
ncbi:hypothetical protein K7J14_11880 [Treponema zuelzerae]|uniref:Uncharacterized protein n=1 Tax=Teretinema zuelzerae TaxID=156 RepID=A0AAE3JM50_9SPIR|nr:hypothetical protein [Teretinema zuelzerae]MCD1655394.1 hypothetical protein [Teretinema zuelzerae]